MTTRVFNTECRYDAIIGRNVLNQLGVLLDFKEGMMYWDDAEAVMRLYEPKEVEDRTVSTEDTTMASTTLAEQLMLDVFDAVYDEQQTSNFSKNE